MGKDCILESETIFHYKWDINIFFFPVSLGNCECHVLSFGKAFFFCSTQKRQVSASTDWVGRKTENIVCREMEKQLGLCEKKLIIKTLLEFWVSFFFRNQSGFFGILYCNMWLYLPAKKIEGFFSKYLIFKMDYFRFISILRQISFPSKIFQSIRGVVFLCASNSGSFSFYIETWSVPETSALKVKHKLSSSHNSSFNGCVRLDYNRTSHWNREGRYFFKTDRCQKVQQGYIFAYKMPPRIWMTKLCIH